MSTVTPSVSVPRIWRCLLLVGGALALLSCASGPSAAASQAQASTDGHGLTGVDIDGGQHALDVQFESGRAVALVFWQPWCASCVKEAPEVEVARTKWGNQVSFYGVVSGSDQAVDELKVRGLVLKLGLQYPQLRDRDGSWSRRFKVNTTPTVMVFSPGGELLFRGNHLPEDWPALLNV